MWLQSEEAQEVAQRHTPAAAVDKQPSAAPAAPEHQPKSNNKPRKQQQQRQKRPAVQLSAEQRKQLNGELKQVQQQREKRLKGSTIQLQRASLPAAKHKAEVIEKLESHQVHHACRHSG